MSKHQNLLILLFVTLQWSADVFVLACGNVENDLESGFNEAGFITRIQSAAVVNNRQKREAKIDDRKSCRPGDIAPKTR